MANGSSTPGLASFDNLQTAVTYLSRSLDAAQQYCDEVAVRGWTADCTALRLYCCRAWRVRK